MEYDDRYMERDSIVDYIKTYQDADAETMYRYMKTFLGESNRVL